MAEVAGLKDQITAGEQRERELDEQIKTPLAGIPNMLFPDVPDGKDESENIELRRWGTPRDFKEGFEPKQHFEIGEALGLMDFEAAAKISGARFTVLKVAWRGSNARLASSCSTCRPPSMAIQKVNPPLLVRDDAVFGTAQLPKFEGDLFAATPTPDLEAITNASSIFNDRYGGAFFRGRGITRFQKLAEGHYRYSPLGQLEFGRILRKASRYFLIPTSEVPLTNLVRESILAEADLPIASPR